MLRTVIDSLTMPLLVADSGIGVAIGIVKANQEHFFGLGRMQSETPEVPTLDTVYEIGSVTKTFTALLLARMVDQGIVALDQPAHSLLPQFAHLPESITLQQLATHTSGLPHLPRNIVLSFLKNRRNPYVNYTDREFAAYMRKCSVNTRQVGTIRYSNLGMGLLGYLLTEITNKSFDTVLQEEICRPLGLHETFSKRAFSNTAHLAQPHDDNGLPTSRWDFHRPFEGAGAILSTPRDLLHFISAYLSDHPSDLNGPLKSCLKETTRKYPSPGVGERLFNAAGRLRAHHTEQQVQHIGIGLGWFQSRLTTNDHIVWWHTGATGGYQTFVGMIREIELGIVILANRGLRIREFLFPQLYVTGIGFALINYLSNYAYALPQ